MNTTLLEKIGDISKGAGLNLTAVGFYANKKQLFDVAEAAFALGAAQEREECAKFLERFSAENNGKVLPLNVMAGKIRARSKA